jgi:CMP-N-acetylneuraminic acid synthetase
MEHEAEEEAKRREKAAADRAKLDKMAWEAEEEAEDEADKVFRLDPYSDLTPNQLFCNVVRRNILEAYPRLSPKNVNALLSTLWSKTLNLDERRNFTHILAEAKTREMDRLGREKRSKAKKAEEAAAWKETAAAFEEDEDDEEEDDDDSDDDSDYGDSD